MVSRARVVLPAFSQNPALYRENGPLQNPASPVKGGSAGKVEEEDVVAGEGKEERIEISIY